jgi:hypothetical protein
MLCPILAFKLRNGSWWGTISEWWGTISEWWGTISEWWGTIFEWWGTIFEWWGTISETKGRFFSYNLGKRSPSLPPEEKVTQSGRGKTPIKLRIIRRSGNSDRCRVVKSYR